MGNWGDELELFYVEQLRHSYEVTRREAITIVGKLRKDDYVDLLISISQNDSSYHLQWCAAYALSDIGTPRALEANKYWHKHHKREE